MTTEEEVMKIRMMIIIHHFKVQQLYMVLMLWLLGEYKRKLNNRKYGEKPSKAICASRKRAREELLHEIMTNNDVRDIIRMKPHAFMKLCNILHNEGELRSTQRVSVEEQVAKFLHIVSCNVRNRTICFFFRRSKETTSRHFHMVLRALISLERKFFKQPIGSEVCPEVLNNPRFYPYFKNCLGAIDGTHIRVRVSREDAARYRGRKMHPTQNVMAACTFDLKFTYVLPGWEGTATDSRIIKNALTREDKLKIPHGKYYLVDVGFPHTTGLMTPYRGVRYHLKEYSVRGPEDGCELFNLRHASLRNAIERAFGVLKKRFPIIGSTEPYYSVETQSQIVLACCILHNFLMDADPDERLLAEVDNEILNHANETPLEVDENDEANAEYLRNCITYDMWQDYSEDR